MIKPMDKAEMLPEQVEALRVQVQRNCDISDYRHAADYTLCIYLMRMREYYRWAHRLSWTDAIKQGDISRWISEKEASWDDLAGASFKPVTFAGKHFEIFDQAGINADLMPMGYAYQAGYGRFGKPVFVLAELESYESGDAYSLITLGREWARELASPVAATQGRDIHLRTHSLSRLIWELVEEWRWNKPDNAMSEVMKRYDFDGEPLRALAEATEEQAEMLTLHEIGEVLSAQMLGQRWDEWVHDHSGEHAELYARASRDYLADCLVTLPGLLALEEDAALHFYFANLTPLRKSLFPSLVEAYQNWRRTGCAEQVKRCVRTGQQYWKACADELILSEQPPINMKQWVEAHAL